MIFEIEVTKVGIVVVVVVMMVVVVFVLRG